MKGFERLDRCRGGAVPAVAAGHRGQRGPQPPPGPEVAGPTGRLALAPPAASRPRRGGARRRGRRRPEAAYWTPCDPCPTASVTWSPAASPLEPSEAETATVLGISGGSVKSHLSRGLDRLRRELAGA